MTKQTLVSRRTALTTLSCLIGLAPALSLAALPADKPLVEVWKAATCGCCKDWIAHLEANGFAVKINDTGNDEARKRFGVAAQYGSCHTGFVAGYALEGHVPAREIHRVLKDKPAAIGLAVPGMPLGSPGMDGPAYGGRKHAFEVLLLAKDGSATPYQRYDGSNTR